MALLSARLNIGRLNAERLHWIGADTTAPTVPLNLVASATGPRSIGLTWDASSDYYGVASYRIERAIPGFAYAEIGASVGLTYTDHGLVPLTQYCYRVRAQDAAGLISGYSNVSCAQTTDLPPLTGVKIKVGGVWTDVAQYARVAGATVTQALNEVADTAAITFSGTIPYPLAGVQITLLDAAGAAYFTGHITAVRTIYEGRAKNVAYECDCLDYTWLLNSRKVTGRYTGATSWVLSNLIGFAPAGYTLDFSGMTINPVLDEITFTNEDLAQAISRTCERGGLYWYVDYTRAVLVFTSTAIPSAGTIDDTHARTAVKLAKHDDAVAIATRVLARGGGSTAVLDLPVGFTTLPIDDPVWYAAAGGYVECGPQRLSYAGVVGASEQGSTMGKIAVPTAGMNYWAPGSTGTGSFTAGQYYCGVTNVTTEGETPLGPLTRITNPANSNIMIGITAGQQPTEPRIKGFRAYISTVNGGPETMRMYRYDNMVTNPYGFNWNEPAGYYIATAPSGLTTTPAPTVSTAGDGSAVAAPGSTSLQVDDLAPFPASGWVVVPGDQVVRYTGKSATSGPGTLTGIPASGAGSITAPVKGGTVKVQPHLIGIPASGAYAIVYPIKGGDEVYVLVIREDATAIAALAAATEGDGIREEFLTDGRLAIPELTARADATLAMRKQSLVTVNFESRDPAVTVGKTITFNTTQPPIVGTFLIQRVTISQFQARGSIGHPDPLRVVEASSRRYTFDDLVQQIKLLGRIN